MRLPLLSALLTLLLAAPAAAAPELEYYEDDGKPMLRAVTTAPAVWGACGAADCSPIADQQSQALSALGLWIVTAQPGDTPAGTVFELVVQPPGQPEERVRTPAWQGPQSVQTPPRLAGDLTVGGAVEIVRGTATGGFEGAYSMPEIWACAQPEAGPCYVIAAPKFVCIGLPVSERPACAQRLRITIDPRWAGWSLIASEAWRSGRLNLVEPAVWIEPPWGPFGVPVANARLGLSAASGPVAGPPAAAPPAPATEPLQAVRAPRVVLRSRAVRRGGRLQLGRVSCPQRCSVTLTVNGAARTFRVTGTQTLTIPVRKGRIKVRVVVDGKRVASATLKR